MAILNQFLGGAGGGLGRIIGGVALTGSPNYVTPPEGARVVVFIATTSNSRQTGTVIAGGREAPIHVASGSTVTLWGEIGETLTLLMSGDIFCSVIFVEG